MDTLERLKEHCDKIGIKLQPGDDIQLAMLAQSIERYYYYAKKVSELGATQKPDNGGWDQIRPEYTAMNKELQNVLKLASKFGLNPVDRLRLKIKEDDSIDPFKLLNRK